jgi:hypothetical protein
VGINSGSTKIGTLAIINNNFQYSLWNHWQTPNTIVFTGKEKPFPTTNFQRLERAMYIGQLCEIVYISRHDYDEGYVYIYIPALKAYTDMYLGMLDVVLEPT